MSSCDPLFRVREIGVLSAEWDMDGATVFMRVRDMEHPGSETVCCPRCRWELAREWFTDAKGVATFHIKDLKAVCNDPWSLQHIECDSCGETLGLQMWGAELQDWKAKQAASDAVASELERVMWNLLVVDAQKGVR